MYEQLEPSNVFYFFEEISKIPRGSGNTKAMSDYCVKFAMERELCVIKDEVGNVIIRKAGTKGYERSETIILQGHMDMVCEKTQDSTHNFSKDPLELYVEDGYLKARDTTLGADNGIAVAFILALLDSKDIAHPPLEAVFTVDEETTMVGVENIDMFLLKGRKMINLDSENEGVLTVGCAGGLFADVNIPFSVNEVNKEVITIEIKSLLGGHSGIEIANQRVNANKLMGALLAHLMYQSFDFNLISINGGSRENVIAYDCTAKICIDSDKKEFIVKEISDMYKKWKSYYKQDEPHFQIITSSEEKQTVTALAVEDSKKVVYFIVASPQGVQTFDRRLKDQVETSLNLGIVRTNDDNVFINYMIRSSSEDRLDEMLERISAFAHLISANVSISDRFPAWYYDPESELYKLMEKTYIDFFGNKPIVHTVHGGLECGIFKKKRSELDCISIGVNILNCHSTAEALEIESTARTWEYLKEVLKNCK